MTEQQEYEVVERQLNDIPRGEMGPGQPPVPQEDRSLEVAQAEVYRTEVQVTTHRAMMLEAKAREMHGYFNFAKAFAKTKMVRKEYQWNGVTDEEAASFNMQPLHNLCAAMMYGAKLGIEPEDAGLLVITINDQPGLEAKTMVGIVKRWCDLRQSQGLNKPFDQGGDWMWEVEADNEHAIWAARRNGHEVSCEWTMERALNADLTTNDHMMTTRNSGRVKDMYGKFPVEMLRARAQSEAARIQFSDVLRGMQYSAEELRLIERTVVKPVETVQGGKGAAALERVLEQHAEAKPENHVEHRSGFVAETAQPDSEQPAPEDHTTAPADEAQTAGVDQGPPNEDTPVPDYLLKLRQTMHILLTTDAKVTDRAKKLKVLGFLVGRELESSKDMTDDETNHAIEVLQLWKRGRVLGQNVVAILKGDALVAVPDGVAAEAEQHASMDQLKELRALYRDNGMQGKAMLDHMSGVLGYNVDNINALTDVDVRDCTRKLRDQR